MRIEQLDQLGEVGERAGQPVDLVDDHHIDAARRDILAEAPEAPGAPAIRPRTRHRHNGPGPAASPHAPGS